MITRGERLLRNGGASKCLTLTGAKNSHGICGVPNRSLVMIEVNREEFIAGLLNNGWTIEEAVSEWEWTQSCDSDIDGDMG